MLIILITAWWTVLVAELVSKGVYDQRDIDNINSNDLYVSQFIRDFETNPIQEAADRLHEATKWKKEGKIRGNFNSTSASYICKVQYFNLCQL